MLYIHVFFQLESNFKAIFFGSTHAIEPALARDYTHTTAVTGATAVTMPDG